LHGKMVTAMETMVYLGDIPVTAIYLGDKQVQLQIG
jgi:hypothetical protein